MNYLDAFKNIITKDNNVAVVYAVGIHKENGKITRLKITQDYGDCSDCPEFKLSEVRAYIKRDEWIVKTYNPEHPEAGSAYVAPCINDDNSEYLMSAKDGDENNNLDNLPKF